jgi:sec-independent protein translocase protein TatA
MNTELALFNLGGGEIILLLAIVLILFGAKKIPELAKGLGQGIKEFKKATQDVTDEMHNAINDNPSAQKRVAPPATVATETQPTVPQSSTPVQKS